MKSTSTNCKDENSSKLTIKDSNVYDTQDNKRDEGIEGRFNTILNTKRRRKGGLLIQSSLSSLIWNLKTFVVCLKSFVFSLWLGCHSFFFLWKQLLKVYFYKPQCISHEKSQISCLRIVITGYILKFISCLIFVKKFISLEMYL